MKPSPPVLGPYEVLDERSLVKTRWLDARLERCRTPTGAVIQDYTVLHFPDWSVAVPVTPDGRFVMTRQWRQGAEVLSLECPGGVVDAGEDAATAAGRELTEETGYQGAAADWSVRMLPNPALQRNWFHATLFTGCVRVTEPQAHETERLETLLMTGAEIMAAIRSGEMAHALQVGVFLRLFADRPDLLEPQ